MAKGWIILNDWGENPFKYFISALSGSYSILYLDFV